MNYAINKTENIEKVLKRESQVLFKSIARRIRKTILISHKGCVQHITRNFNTLDVNALYQNDICPTAFAYVLWRKVNQGYINEQDVDNSYSSPFTRRPCNRIIDNITIDLILESWRRYNYINKIDEYNEKRIELKWVILKCIEIEIIYDFYKCLKVAYTSYNQYRPFNWEELNNSLHEIKYVISQTTPQKYLIHFCKPLELIDLFDFCPTPPRNRFENRSKYKIPHPMDNIF